MASSNTISAESLSIVPLLKTCQNLPLLMIDGWAASQLLKYQTTWMIKLRMGPTSNGLLDEETLRSETEILRTIPKNLVHLREAVVRCFEIGMYLNSIGRCRGCADPYGGVASKWPKSPSKLNMEYIDKYSLSDAAYDGDVDSVSDGCYPSDQDDDAQWVGICTRVTAHDVDLQQWKGNVKKSKRMVENCLRPLQCLADQLENIHYKKLYRVPDDRFGMEEYFHLGDKGYRYHEDVDVEGLRALKMRVLGVLLDGAPKLESQMGQEQEGLGLGVRLSEVSDERLQSILQVVFGVLRRRNRFVFWRKRAGKGRTHRASINGGDHVNRRGRPVLGSLIHARWPAPPVVGEGEVTFICPFCGDTLLRAESEHGNWEYVSVQPPITKHLH